MQKKIEAELMSLAHSILKMKNGGDVEALKNKAHKLYEQLSVLSFLERYVRETPQNTKTMEELVTETFVEITEEKNTVEVLEEEVVEQEMTAEENTEIVETVVVEEIKIETEETIVENGVVEELEEMPEPIVDLFHEKEEIQEFEKIEESTPSLQSTLEREFGTTVSLDVTTDLFENAQRLAPKKSINDAMMQQKSLQIDLNDRIAFVKHLFANSQEDFNRVVSQLNTMESQKEALSFLKMIKKEYNWSGKEVYEERLLLLIDRKFN
ncbi:hypothetical protein [Wenyingzhuangia sp. 2_MG-2023]|uniref:hypothetical protein n=1 Tax=Wenyingzhuangia sp. 2_MG-2023 TaxID=3062639 RepID=UPI0026E178C6|nr:hypothetical protein [Wenyingzhuangia sp. 2_MG-2023]MDO6736520.1 hypothetical protein [Wenyingzhuangia sp. 2_MG-2023]MDO6801185.1 hypothetical protein [Wenyingzhuangia sp. 1_MG-2023]